jgi:hypothetical protein
MAIEDMVIGCLTAKAQQSFPTNIKFFDAALKAYMQDTHKSQITAAEAVRVFINTQAFEKAGFVFPGVDADDSDYAEDGE